MGTDCRKCGLNCALTLCSPCMKCARCICQLFCKLCSPCLNCGKCIFGCFAKCIFGCFAKFNCCNVECGLPCKSPPGCVCIFPAKCCGFGWTCPYFCCSCGSKHCCKMPKEEQRFWFNKRAETRAKGDTGALRKENEDLKKEIAQMKMSSGVESACKSDA